MLHVAETRVATPALPGDRRHTHFTFARAAAGARPRRVVAFTTTAEDALEVMDRKGVRAVVNLTGGSGKGLEKTLAALRPRAPRALPHLHRADVGRLARPALPAAPGRRDREGGPGRRAGPEGPEDARALPARARPRGAARQGGRPALRPDVGGLRGPPPARVHPRLRPRGVLPADRLHERALGRARAPPRLVVPRPGLPEPPRADGGARPRVRPPPEDAVRGPPRRARRGEPRLRVASRSTASQPHRRDRRAHRRARPPAARPRGGSSRTYQDRILFGTDAVPPPDGESTPQQVFKDELYEIYYRFLETEDEYFDYAPAPVPPQGRWRIYGIGLPDGILKKVYHENAERLLGLTP